MITREKHDESELVADLFKVGAHFGFTRSRRHPSVKPFLFGVKNKIEIFDLEKTEEALKVALEFIKKLSENGSQILFVGGKSEAKTAVKSGAESANMPYVAGRWIGGTLTNFPQIRKRVSKLEELTTQKEKGELAKYTKRERMLIDRQIENLRTYFEGLIPLKELPKAVFIVDSRKEHIAVKEAQEMNIPILALCGSDCNLSEVDYAIPANDSSVASIAYFVNKIVEAYKHSKRVSDKK